jgi:hypothetical protein
MENKFYKTNITARLNIHDKPMVGDDVYLQKAMANLVDKCKTAGIFRDPDSQYIQGIYVSSGMNSNNDVFLPSELGKSFGTALMKPIDIDHVVVEKESIVETLAKHSGNDALLSFGFGANTIIGAIYDSAFIDSITGDVILARELEAKIPEIYDKLIASDTSFVENIQRDDVRYDVIIAGVLWNFLFPKTVKQIVQDISNGERALSMECWFNGYDWLVNNRIYTREEAPHLQDIWDRRGTVNGQSLGRVLRNIVFGGGGAVKNPANVNAFDFMEVASVKEGVYKARASLVKTETISKKEITNNDGGNEMDIKEIEQAISKAVDKVGEVSDLKQEVKTVASENKTLSEKIESLKSDLSAKESQINDLLKDAQTKADVIKALEDEKSNLASASDTAKSELDLAKKELEAKSSELESSVASLKDVTEKLEAFKLAQTIANRIDLLKSKDVLVSESEDAQTVASLSDEDFEKLMEDRVKVSASKNEPVLDLTLMQKKAVASFSLAGGKKVDSGLFAKFSKI